MLKLLLKKTPSDATSLFNQYDKAALANLEKAIWFTSKPLSKRTFQNFLPEICKNAGVEKRYTPHCIRATTIQHLNDSGWEARHIMFLSGHRNESSLRSYRRTVSTSKKKGSKYDIIFTEVTNLVSNHVRCATCFNSSVSYAK